jgi:cysteinyl-tRNA synthetase
MFMVASHYRSPIDYSDKALADTLAGLDRIYGAWETLLADHAAVSVMEPQDLDKKGNKLNKQMDQAYKDFMEAMDDDFNMAKALGHLFDLVRVINTISLWPADKMGKLDLQDKALGIFETFRSILGIPLRVPEEYRKATKELFLKKSGITADKIDDLIKQRTDARANKDFARADQIRDELLDMGIAIKDSAEKTTWNVKFSQ